MPSFHELTTAQLKQAVQIREQIESLQEKLASLLGGSSPASSRSTKGKRTMSAATKKKMAAAQQARYAKLKTAPTTVASKKSVPTKSTPMKKVMSPKAKAKIAAAMKARWAAKKKVGP